MINGAYLKKLRLANKYTLTQLSAETGFTPSFLSQIERGLKEPSLSTLRKLSECFSVPLISFFRPCASLDREIFQETAPVQIVQKSDRVKMDVPGLLATCHALTLPNRRPDGSSAIQGSICTLPPATWCVENSMALPVDQCIFIAHGNIVFKSRTTTLYIQEGDCLFVQADTPYNVQNLSDDDCILLVFSG